MRSSWNNSIKNIFLAGILLLAVSVFCRAGGLKKEIFAKDYLPKNAALRSAAFPGWGQAYNHQTGKAYAIGIAEVVLLASAYASEEYARYKYDDYKENGLKDGALYDDYQKYHQASMIAGGIAAGVWAYSIIEAYVFAKDELKRRKKYSLEFNYDGRSVFVACRRRF